MLLGVSCSRKAARLVLGETKVEAGVSWVRVGNLSLFGVPCDPMGFVALNTVVLIAKPRRALAKPTRALDAMHDICTRSIHWKR